MLTGHHFIAKHQAKAFPSTHRNLKDSDVLVVEDFAKKLFLFCSECHPWVALGKQPSRSAPFFIYYRSDTEMKNHSVCFISNHMTHETATVYSFQRSLIIFIKENLPQVTHVNYFSEGSCAQYKKYKNFANLCHHVLDFNLTASYSFFAIPHGKRYEQ